MKTKKKIQISEPPKGGTPNATISAPGFGFVQHFTADSVTIEEPGSSVTHTRAEVEGWLVGMNAARRLSDEKACREEVARTIEGNRRSRGNETLTKTESLRPSVPSKKSEAPHVVSYGKLAAILCLLCAFAPLREAWCSEIIRGYAPQDGQQLYAADLDNLIDESVIGVQFYNDQQTTPILGAGYDFLVLNPANQTYYRLNAQQVLYGNTNIFLNAPPAPVPGYGLLVFCDPTNGWVASTTVSNFLWNSASNINVAGLSFANTNNGGATNAFVLPKWPYPFSSLIPGQPIHFLVFDTNGIPYREGLSNMEAGLAIDFAGYNYPYWQEFYPWLFMGTNTVFPYTNAFGWTTNFPIRAFYQPNNGNTLTNATLTDADTIPVNSWQQGTVGVGPTNTSATLFSLYEYMTNKNALPPYTIARVQFAGVPDSMAITNMDPVTGIITNVSAAANWSNGPVAVSWAGETTQLPTAPTVQSNIVYYAVQTNWPVLAFQIYTNYATAAARTSPLVGNGVNISHTGTLYWLTNYTSVNCDVIQISAGTVIGAGVYYVQFRSASQTPFYYVTGMVPNTQSSFYGWVALDYDNGWEQPTTNGFAIGCHEATTSWQAPQLMQVLVQPQ